MKVTLTKEKAYWWFVFCITARSSLLFFIYKGLGIFYLSSLTAILFGALMFAPVFIIMLQNFKYAYTEFTFVFIFCAFQIMLLAVGAAHPNYLEYFHRPVYGVYEVFFSISRGALWGWLAFSGIKNGKKVLNAFHAAAGISFLHGLYQYFEAKSLGYWEVHDATGEMIKVNYSLTFGYQLIFCGIVFLYFFLKHKTWYDFFGAALSFFMVLTDGSRGPFLCLLMFLALYVLAKVRKREQWKKILLAVFSILLCFMLVLLWQNIASWLVRVASKAGFSSRTLSMLASGRIKSDSSRSIIFDMCRNRIKNMGFFGLGPFGDRTFIAPVYYWGYPHNVALELILDYGWMIALVIMTAIVAGTVRMIRYAPEPELMVFCILLSCNVKLFISSTYWAEYTFWGMLAWMIQVLMCIDKRKRIVYNALLT